MFIDKEYCRQKLVPTKFVPDKVLKFLRTANNETFWSSDENVMQRTILPNENFTRFERSNKNIKSPDFNN